MPTISKIIGKYQLFYKWELLKTIHSQKKSLAQEVREKSDISERKSKGWR